MEAVTALKDSNTYPTGMKVTDEELKALHLLRVCFASIRFRRCQITLPLFERDWQSLKSALRQHSLPKVQVAIKALPKDFSTFSERRIPYVPVK